MVHRARAHVHAARDRRRRRARPRSLLQKFFRPADDIPMLRLLPVQLLAASTCSWPWATATGTGTAQLQLPRSTPALQNAARPAAMYRLALSVQSALFNVTVQLISRDTLSLRQEHVKSSLCAAAGGKRPDFRPKTSQTRSSG